MNVEYDLAAVRQWIDEHATEVSVTDAMAPLTDLEPLDGLIGEAVVTGFGESTRAGHEIMVLGHRLLRYLVEHKGYRTLALQDDESVIAELDEYLRTGEGDLLASAGDLWNPWRNRELLEILEWARAYNQQHPGDPLRLLGLAPAAARLAHYDEVAAYVARTAPDRLAQLHSHFDPIRTAHQVNEHVQTAKGTHPGRPFAEHARDVRTLVSTLPPGPGHDRATELTQLIVDFHENGIAGGGYDFEAENFMVAEAIADHHHDTGRKILYWEGLAHTANAEHIEVKVFSVSFRSVGRVLRRRMGEGYVSVGVGFDHGRIHNGDIVPAPQPDFADAVFGSAGPQSYLLDLHAGRPDGVTQWLRGPHKVRVIAGVYKPEEDPKHFVSGGPLDEWFDAIFRIKQIKPTSRLD